ncbi:hypothetical protein shim_35390 [Shimia sp. SK013]|uniref:hypothetical protein n=1 Tax=Shimia sp. SK013 TaxID=1389006 RepID=UPI0006B56989|nr:hypothetical protein [Shimia sp. SK013]KPA20548.1 hypothetical protein shim_35390 [Shimia sp. SK013]
MTKPDDADPKPGKTVLSEVVTLPVFPAVDPVSRLQAIALAGKLPVKLQFKEGTKTVKRDVKSFDFPLADLIEGLKIKMFKEKITDQTVYGILFEDRLQKHLSKQLLSGAQLDKLIEALKAKAFENNVEDKAIFNQLFDESSQKGLAGIHLGASDLDELIEAIKIKMFDDGVSDQDVFDTLFEDRLQPHLSNKFFQNMKFDDVLEMLKIKMFDEKVDDEDVFARLFEGRLSKSWTSKKLTSAKSIARAVARKNRN